MAQQILLEFYNTATGSFDATPISVPVSITNWTDLSYYAPEKISIADNIVYYEGYRFYRESELTNLVTTSTPFPSTEKIYYYYLMPQINNNKFHFMLNGESKTIDLKTNFGSYFNQGDNTNCDYLGVLEAAIDSGYKAGDKTIYAGQRHPYPVATRLSSCYYKDSNPDSLKTNNRLVMTNYVRFNEQITSNILNTISTIEFEIDVDRFGGGASDKRCIKAIIPRDNFRLLYSEGTTDIGITAGGNDIIYIYTDYTNGSAGSTIEFTDWDDSNSNYTVSRGTTVTNQPTNNQRGAKLKITVNYTDGTKRSSYVIDGNNRYAIYPLYSNNNSWLYYGNAGDQDDQSDLIWEGNTNSTYATRLISGWYPMENKT